jgi:hypothetical protein
MDALSSQSNVAAGFPRRCSVPTMGASSDADDAAG